MSGTTISPDEVNANFALLGNALNRTGGTMTGTLTARDITPASTATYDLGVTGTRFRDAWLSRNLTVGGTLDVTGAVSFSAATMTGTLTARDIAASSGSTYDIGATGTRFRDAWLSRNLDVGGTLGVTGAATFSAAVTGSGTTSGGSSRYAFSGTHTGGAGANLYGLSVATSLTPDASDTVSLFLVSGAAATITEASSGTHPVIASAYLIPPTISGAAATVTNTATLYITDAPSATVTGGNYALLVADGASLFGGDLSTGGFTAYATADFPVGRALISGTAPELEWYDSNASVDEKYWRLLGNAGVLTVQTVNDAYSSASTVFSIARDGRLSYTETAVMSWNSRTAGTIYQAASDGWVYAYADAVTGGGGAGSFVMHTDANATPTTIRQRSSVNNNYQSGSMAVKAGDYYRIVVTTDSGTIAATMFFVPNGTAGGV